MATVTGFTAERMLVIENETVVDGEVVGNNLHLLRRDGISIDAGNVRGPTGATGPQGTPGTNGKDGVIQSVNDQSITSVYSPRVFANKAAIDGWTTAPNGSIALALDTAITWQKDGVGWFIVNHPRIFSSISERDSRWLNPPDGSICQAPVGVDFIRSGGTWVPAPTTHYRFTWSQTWTPAASVVSHVGNPGNMGGFITASNDASKTTFTFQRNCHVDIALSLYQPNTNGSKLSIGDAAYGGGCTVGGCVDVSAAGGGIGTGINMLSGTFPAGKVLYGFTRQGTVTSQWTIYGTITIYPVNIG